MVVRQLCKAPVPRCKAAEPAGQRVPCGAGGWSSSTAFLSGLPFLSLRGWRKNSWHPDWQHRPGERLKNGHHTAKQPQWWHQHGNPPDLCDRPPQRYACVFPVLPRQYRWCQHIMHYSGRTVAVWNLDRLCHCRCRLFQRGQCKGTLQEQDPFYHKACPKP